MISAAGSEKLTKGFGPLLPGFIQIPFGDHEALNAEIDETIAAIVIEPIQGEGGILPVPDQCLKGLRDCCDKMVFYLFLMRYNVAWVELESYLHMNGRV